MQRSLRSYKDCTAEAVSSGSKAQMVYFVSDAKTDIAALANSNEQLLALLRDATDALEATTKGRFSGWECTEDELLGEFRAGIAKAEALK